MEREQPIQTLEPEAACLRINQLLAANGLFGEAKRATETSQNSSWRIAPEPFSISASLAGEFEELGQRLYAFNRGIQRLYELSLRGKQPDWIREYFEAGKPETVVDFGKIRRFRNHFPVIIRPDILLTENGYVVSELDSVPGGFGLLGALSSFYGELGHEVIGGASGIPHGLAHSLRSLTAEDRPHCGIIVSDEASDYWDEMVWMGQALTTEGLPTYVRKPEEVTFQEDGLYVEDSGSMVRIHILYRFFELFDLKNIPKIDLFLYAIRRQLVVATPPMKSFLEEKLSYGLLHHPRLGSYWEDELGKDTFAHLLRVFPKTWIVDGREVPPHGVIPGLSVKGQPLTAWHDLQQATKAERQLVLKISGFSPEAWGSRGVHVGHDMAASEWGHALEKASASFSESPYVLQDFHKAVRVDTSFYDFAAEEVRPMEGRVRLCPYYFVTDDQVRLHGILATICPLDKKLIHGMVDAVMVPTSVSNRSD